MTMHKKSLISLAVGAALLAAAGFASPAAADQAPIQLAQAAPADDYIKNAQSDVVRYREQYEGLHSGQTGSAKRILVLLGQSEDRMKQSTNQADPSWIETDMALQELKADVQGWLDSQ